MALMTRLSDRDLRAIVDRVVGERWRNLGYDHADVVSEDDVYGEPAFSVTVWVRSGSPEIPVDIYSRTALAMRDAINAAGEDRYVYLHVARPDDPIIDDDADAS